jgi:hypothetical protein
MSFWDRSGWGLYYPRCDVQYEEEDNHVYVDPFTANVGIAYIRVTVKRGQNAMLEKLSTKEKVQLMSNLVSVRLMRDGEGRRQQSLRVFSREVRR